MKHLVNARVMYLYLATVAVSESVSYLNVHSIKQRNPIKISARRVNIFVLPLLLGSINYTLGRVSDSQSECDQSLVFWDTDLLSTLRCDINSTVAGQHEPTWCLDNAFPVSNSISFALSLTLPLSPRPFLTCGEL